MATFTGNDTLNDTLTGGGGSDQLYGLGGNDSLNGGGGADSLYGGNGNDILDGGTSGDRIEGGAGDDRILLTGTFGTDTILGGETTDETIGDTIDASALTSAASVVFTGAEAGTFTTGSAVTFSQIERLILTGLADSVNATLATSAVHVTAGAGNDTLLGGSGADTLIGGIGADSILSGDGNDLVQDENATGSVTGSADYVDLGAGDDTYLGTGAGTADTDQIYGGTGNDTITALGGNDTLYGGAGNDLLTAGNDTLISAGDQLFGGGGADTLIGAGTADTLDGGSGADQVSGGAGNDVLSGGDSVAAVGTTYILNGNFSAGLTGWTGTDMEVNPESAYFFGGSGTNTVSEIDGNSGQTTVMSQTFEVPGTQTATLSLRAAVRTNGAGTVGTDGLRAEIVDATGAVILDQTILPTATTATYSFSFTFPATGTYTLRLTEVGNNDSLGAVIDDVQITGTSIGYDTANDTLSGGDGDDTLSGYLGNDSLSGDAGADSLVGAGGDDTLSGGLGADTVSGGIGNDLILGSGSDVVDGGTGLDRLDLTADGTADTVTFTSGTGGTFNTTSTFANIETFVSDAGADLVNAANATIDIGVLTGADNDTVTGGSGNDSLDGGSGADSLFGGSGNDTILGGAGADTLAGGAGADVLAGGDGSDRFLIAALGGNDTLTGGETIDRTQPDFDLLDMTGLTSAVWVNFGGAEAGTATTSGGVVSFAQIERLATGSGADTINASGSPEGVWVDAGAGADIFLGGSGNDTVTGAGGADNLFGGSGADSLDGGDENDWLEGGDDADTLVGGGGDDALYGSGGDDWLYAGAGADLLFGGLGDDRLYAGDANDDFAAEAGNDQIFGGAGDDTFDGGIGDTVDGGAAGNDLLDLSDWGWARTNVIYNPSDPQSGRVEFLDLNGAVTGSMTFSNIEKVMPCFTPGTLILTGSGLRSVETLQPGDLVETRDHGLQPLRWIGKRALSLADLIVQPQLKPRRFAAGSLGDGLPRRDLTVSPQHRMLIEGARAEMLFGEPEVLVAARHLGAAEILPPGVTYLHLLFDAHEIIQAEGAWTESFQPAARMLSQMEAETRAEIEALFPDLCHAGFAAARLSLKAHEARVLMAI